MRSLPPTRNRSGRPILTALVACCLLWAGGFWLLSEVLRPDPPPSITDARAQTYLVDFPQGVGSCIPIAEYRDFTIFLTADHVVEFAAGEPIDVYVKGFPHRVLRAERNPLMDVAWLLVQVAVPVVPMDGRPVQFGDEVFAAGHTLGVQTLTHGYVSENNLCSADVFPGMSGGGVFRNGMLVGTISKVGIKRIQLPQGFPIPCYVPFIHFFVPLSDALPWIRATIPS